VAAPAPAAEPERQGAEVIDIMSLLKRSVKEKAGADEAEAAEKAGGKTSGEPAPAKRRSRKTA
jgi:non-homologous end joining protein Ku